MAMSVKIIVFFGLTWESKVSEVVSKLGAEDFEKWIFWYVLNGEKVDIFDTRQIIFLGIPEFFGGSFRTTIITSLTSSENWMSRRARRENGEDDSLSSIAREAEARLAAKRAARAEAREIRLKELEKQQREVNYCHNYPNREFYYDRNL